MEAVAVGERLVLEKVFFSRITVMSIVGLVPLSILVAWVVAVRTTESVKSIVVGGLFSQLREG